MIQSTLPPFFEQYNTWIFENKWNVLTTINWIASLILVLKIKTQLVVLYWSKKECNTKFYSKWLSKKEFYNLIPYKNSGKSGGVG